MKIVIQFVVVFMISFGAFAQSYFDRIGEMFDSGSDPQIESIINSPWAGRCFERQQPNTPKNVGFYIREKSEIIDSGPIEVIQYEISNYMFHNRAANYLDDKPYEQIARMIEPYFESMNVSYNNFSFFYRQANRPVWTYLRADGEYVVQKFYDQYGYEGKLRCYYWSIENSSSI